MVGISPLEMESDAAETYTSTVVRKKFKHKMSHGLPLSPRAKRHKKKRKVSVKDSDEAVSGVFDNAPNIVASE